MLPGRVLAAAVAAVLLAGAPPASARPAPAGHARCSVVRTVTVLGWTAGADGIYRVTAQYRPYALTVVFPYELSSSSLASASRR
ncbi:hypothetical protein MUY14_45045 [Amycolatopsis sp. FBCC-B4732]|uniref:hypothetical protein n=1 Tax=Amycolatopsis sp. FBCC-B4732 TaxID=3079339 RepID=UPI001FF17918|nr:hypothetical protein [Amycolatopsis sp. FBCC-B4732]UOX88759.1 hypothetical protein MUY14_45045 [Amycolatopsis sp. FBCC-B4732]